MKAPSLISCQNLELWREGRSVLRLDRWDVGPGERWVVMGPNGCGKSSLVLAMLGRLAPWEGNLDILGLRAGSDPILSLRKRIGFCGDVLDPLLDANLNCEDLVSTAFVGTLGRRFDQPTSRHRARARKELEVWGLGDRLGSPWSKLSLGQRKRAWLARALAPEPELLILDEPCAGLDPRAREDLLICLESLVGRRPDLPIVLVTHHVEEIPGSFQKLLLLSQGIRHSSGPLESTLRAGYADLFGTGFQPRRRGSRWWLSPA